MTKRSIRYSEDFKKIIVKLYREEKRSASSLVSEYSIVSTITKWIHQYQEFSLPNGKIVTAKEYADWKRKIEN